MGDLKTIVNRVGGIDIAPVLSFSYEGCTFTKSKTTHMNGAKALAYSRMRYDDPQGDYGRQKRQRQVLSALLKKEGKRDDSVQFQLYFLSVQAGAD